MFVSNYNTLFFHHHSQCANDVFKVYAISGESTGDFSGDFSGDWYKHSDFRFRYTESSFTVLQMSCRTWLFEVFRLLVVGDAALVCSRVSSQLTQLSSCIMLQVRDNNNLSTSFDASSALFCECFFLDITILSCKLVSPHQHLLVPSISPACVRVGDEHHERQLFFVHFSGCGSFLICKLFFYTYFRSGEVSDGDLRVVLLVSEGSVPTWKKPGIHFLSTMSTCLYALVCVGHGYGVGDVQHAVNVTCDGEFLEAGLQQPANVWSWYRTFVRKFIGSLCELSAASIETKADRTCIRQTNIEGSDPSGHLTHLSLSPSNFVSQRLIFSRWPTATPRLCRGHRGRFTAHYGSVP